MEPGMRLKIGKSKKDQFTIQHSPALAINKFSLQFTGNASVHYLYHTELPLRN